MMQSPGLGRHHEGVEIGDRARRHPDLGEAGPEDLGGKFGGDDLDLLDRLEPHLVFVAGIAERGPRPETGREHGLGLRVHHIGRGVEIDAVALMDGAVLGRQRADPRLDRVERLAGDARRRPPARNPRSLAEPSRACPEPSSHLSRTLAEPPPNASHEIDLHRRAQTSYRRPKAEKISASPAGSPHARQAAASAPALAQRVARLRGRGALRRASPRPPRNSA